jgi:DNA-binding transcriptional ArsR family regulator
MMRDQAARMAALERGGVFSGEWSMEAPFPLAARVSDDRKSLTGRWEPPQPRLAPPARLQPDRYESELGRRVGSIRPAPTSPRMNSDRACPDRRAELIAERLRVLGQLLRVQLVARLAERATTVQELVDSFETTQQNISQHLGILQRAGVVARHKEGTRVRYELVDPHVLPLLEQAEASLARHLEDLSNLIESHEPTPPP